MKYVANDTINKFKKFISKLYKKEEEALLNKKKKREEIKQKNIKIDKMKNNNKNMTQMPYNLYPSMYMAQMQQVNGQNQPYINDYQNYCCYNGPYQYPPHLFGYPPFMQQYIMDSPKNLEDSINQIYQRGIANNIIAAFFIKENQEKMNEKKTVPVERVELDYDNDNGDNVEEKKINVNEKSDKNEDGNDKQKEEKEEKDKSNEDKNDDINKNGEMNENN